MKILCVIDDLGAGGAQRQLVNIAIQLKHRGHDLTILTYYKREFYKQKLLDADVKIYQLDLKNPIYRILVIRRFIRRGDYDSIIAFLGVPCFLSSFASFPLKKWKLILGERSSNPIMQKSIKSRLLRVFYFKADSIVSNSKTNQEIVKKMAPFVKREKFSVIYNGIDLQEFSPDNTFVFRKNKKLNIVVPASYRRLKNLLGLIEAVKRLNPNEQNLLEINWYGDKSSSHKPDNVLREAEQRISEANLEGIFKLHDLSHEISLIIRKADALGLFSFYEGLPNAVCEGMSCGKPIITTMVSDISELIEERVNGFLCDANNFDSIAMAIRKVLSLSNDELLKMSKLNRDKAAKLFDNIEIISAYEAILSK